MAPLVSNVRRLEPPMPDIEVLFKDEHSIFIEQTERIAAKLEKRNGYGDLSDPLWLVLDVDHYFYIERDHVHGIASNVLKDIEVSGFDSIANSRLNLSMYRHDGCRFRRQDAATRCRLVRHPPP